MVLGGGFVAFRAAVYDGEYIATWSPLAKEYTHLRKCTIRITNLNHEVAEYTIFKELKVTYNQDDPSFAHHMKRKARKEAFTLSKRVEDFTQENLLIFGGFTGFYLLSQSAGL